MPHWEDEWKKIDEIGQGGQGVISKLRHKTDKSRFAVIKELVPKWQGNQQAIDRLHKEASTLEKLNSLNAKVPQLHSSSKNIKTSSPFVVMEYIKGLRFDEWLTGYAPCSPSDACDITLAIAETIKLCHDNDVGHRDLKPTNIILKGGKPTEPYILDFGISFDSKQTHALTRDGEMFWNEFIILPECQDLEGGHQDLRSDITALVGLFFSCITGEPPIVLRDANEVAPHRRKEKIIYSLDLEAEHSERIMWFFDTGFSFNINNRFQTLKKFTQELTKLKESQRSSDLDLFEQFEKLDNAILRKSRTAQLDVLNRQYGGFRNAITNHIATSIDKISKNSGVVQHITPALSDLAAFGEAEIVGDILGQGLCIAFIITRNHIEKHAFIALAAYGVEMDICLYATSGVTTVKNNIREAGELTWDKVAVIPEGKTEIDGHTLSLITDTIKPKLAFEISKIMSSSF
ncbi:MAG: protein kinase [Gammaproteobacteria bacterium]|nr:protein kinase [Gammaproteobacteria bacterium]